MPFLVDGHNVIAALPDIDLEDPHDEAKLILKLRAWTGRERRKAIVVFDGGIPGGYSRALSTAAVRVVFAARHHSTADLIIKERVSRLPDAGNWTVVSSDHEVLDNARQTGTKVITAQEFAEVLNREPDAWKVKPDGISAAEVEAWLAVFKEVPSVLPPSQAAAPTVTASEKKESPQKAGGRPRKRVPREGEPVRTSRTIGEQLEIEPQPQPPRAPAQAYSEKPDEISSAEVDAWLEVFHDPPERAIAPPKPRAKPAPRKPKPLVVNKQGGLSDEDVETWLEVFGDVTEAPPAPATPQKAAKNKPAPTPSAARLVKHKRNLAPTETKESDTLSQEDRDLWQRMFGKGDK